MRIKFILIVIISFLLVSLIIISMIINPTIKYETKESGIFIDPQSAKDNVSIIGCNFESLGFSTSDPLEEVNPDQESHYVVGVQFKNYRPPVGVEIIFPFNLSVDYFCEDMATLTLEQTDKSRLVKVEIDVTNRTISNVSTSIETFCYPARVVDGNKLQIIYNSEEITPYQVHVSANLYKTVSSGKSVLKIFQINENPISFEVQDNVTYQNNNITYKLRLRRDKYQIDQSMSNFVPQISNDFTGNYRYEMLAWNSRNMPGEGVLYLIDNEKVNSTNTINSIILLIAGALIGCLTTLIIELITEKKSS